MRQAVRDAFAAFSRPLEGWCNWPYLDEEGYVTTGMGDLIDPMSLSLVLPWQFRGSGAPATRVQVATDWARVKALQAYRKEGGYSSVFKDSAVLVLSDAGIEILSSMKLDGNDTYLAASFPGYINWPADAQLALNSMAWALGRAFRPEFPRFAAAVDALDFQTAAGKLGDANVDVTCRGQAWMEDSANPGLRRRNVENKVLFQNAAIIVAGKLDCDTLYFPRSLG